ncbi:30S ribosomal protein S15 [Candidatus Aerophobetes bacterium]|nr:30S ribosomal protein S15 [Candidatus Aerophobetes bacterium]
MSITKVKKEKLQKSFSRHSRDTGSPEVQVAVLTERINNLTKHLKLYRKDFNSKRGLLQLVARRRKLLDYLKREDIKKYQSIIKKLGLRR